MREILFRAKDKKTKEWIEGFPVRIYDYGGKVWEIHPFETNFNIVCEVIPETICEFTGKLAKNKKKRTIEIIKDPKPLDVFVFCTLIFIGVSSIELA